MGLLNGLDLFIEDFYEKEKMNGKNTIGTKATEKVGTHSIMWLWLFHLQIICELNLTLVVILSPNCELQMHKVTNYWRRQCGAKTRHDSGVHQNRSHNVSLLWLLQTDAIGGRIQWQQKDDPDICQRTTWWHLWGVKRALLKRKPFSMDGFEFLSCWEFPIIQSICLHICNRISLLRSKHYRHFCWSLKLPHKLTVITCFRILLCLFICSGP